MGAGGLGMEIEKQAKPSGAGLEIHVHICLFLTIEQLSEFSLTLSEPFCKLCSGKTFEGQNLWMGMGVMVLSGRGESS